MLVQPKHQPFQKLSNFLWCSYNLSATAPFLQDGYWAFLGMLGEKGKFAQVEQVASISQHWPKSC